MNNKTTYIKAVLIVFGLLLLSRIPAFAVGNLDTLTLISTVVELIFFVWGIVLITKSEEKTTANTVEKSKYNV